MGDGQRSEGRSMSAFFGFLRQRGLIVLLAIAVGALVGYGISKSKDDEYEADASVQLRGPNSTQPDEFSPGVPDSPADREALALSDPVRRLAERRLRGRIGEERAAELVSGVEAASGQDSATIQVTAVAGTPEAAAAVANAVAVSVITYRRQSTIRRIRRALVVAQRQLDSIKRAAGSQPPGQAAIDLEKRVADLRQGTVVEDGDAEITSRATPPTSPSSPKPGRDAVIGGFAGLLLGLLLAMIREQLDRRLRHSRELEQAFGLPVLASVPKSRALGASNGRALEQLPAHDAEAFQMLRANLRFLNTDKELRSVVVTSPGVGDGKSTVSLNLAKADAAVGKKVLLIEADMRRPRLGALLGMGEEPGLAAYLSNPSLGLGDVARSVPVVHRTNGSGAPLTMDVVIAGGTPGNPSELINSERMTDLVREAEGDYDLVVIDTSPAGIVADAIPLMSQATSVVIVGRVGRITGPEADSLREQLQRIDAPAFGLVANFARSADTSYGYGYY
jgi:capsular exopolysaccharide synthesis family protein